MINTISERDYYNYSESNWESWREKQIQENKSYNRSSNFNIPPIKNYSKSNLNVEFSGYAWLKLKWFRDRGHSEVGAWAITKKDSPLYIIDLKFIKQKNTVAFTKFDDDAIAKMCYDLGEQNIEPNNCMRIWVHTHPGNSASPSGHDETQFNDCIGVNEWFVMLILAKDDSTTCRLGMNSSFGKISQEIPVKYSYKLEDLKTINFPEEIKLWEEEYKSNVTIETYQNTSKINTAYKSSLPKTTSKPKMPYQNIKIKDNEGNLHTCSKKREYNILVEFDCSAKKENFEKLSIREDKDGIWADDVFNINIELVAETIDLFDEKDIDSADFLLIDVYNRYYLGVYSINEHYTQRDLVWTEYSTDKKYVVNKQEHIDFILKSKEIKDGKIIVNDSVCGAV